MRIAPLPALLLGTALALSGCHKSKAPAANSIDAVDNRLVEGMPTAEGHDLGAAIKVDRARTGAGAKGRSASAPAAAAAGKDGTCLARHAEHLEYGNGWAGKLPADLPLHPKARLTEAAGHSGDCEIRAVSFTVPEAPAAVLAWYEQRARAGGWDAGRTQRDGETWLAGTKGDAAFTVMTAAKGDGTAVDTIWTDGK